MPNDEEPEKEKKKTPDEEVMVKFIVASFTGSMENVHSVSTNPVTPTLHAGRTVFTAPRTTGKENLTSANC